jgi:hypothetical protein
MPDQDRFSEHTAKPTWLGQPDHGDDHMHQKNKAVAHRANPTKPGKPSFHVILEFAMDSLREVISDIFEEQLNGWYRVPSVWPTEPT